MPWTIDWSKVTTIEHIKELLQCCDMQPRPSHPMFCEIEHLCKEIDEDGKPIGRVPIGMREMTLTPEAVAQLEHILAERRFANTPLLGESGPKWGDRVRLIENGDDLPKVDASQILDTEM